MSFERRSAPMYLQVGPDQVFATLHESPRDAEKRIPVVLCAPFGWDEVCSYRSRFTWAAELAAAGHPTMRIDLPGSGDSSGGPREPGRLAAWSATIALAADSLRNATGQPSIAAIGIGFGGLVLCNAIAEGASIEEIALWGVASRGRAPIRELRAFSQLEVGRAENDVDPAGDELFVSGFLLSGSAAKEIEEIDLSQKLAAGCGIRRALLLSRDGMAIDKRLQAHLSGIGATVATAAGPGFAAMIAKPHHARAPRLVFATVASWLDSDTRRAGAASTALAAKLDAPAIAELEADGARISERPLLVEQPFGALFGILATPVEAPAHDLCAVLLNAGAIRHIGPSRMWVEAARRWAARGVPTLRLDVEGIGDADGDGERFGELAELYVDGLVDQVRAALDSLEASGIGSEFVLGGLCSGAYWSFHAALADDRVRAVLLLNPRTLIWDASLETARELRRGVLRASAWRKTLRGQVSGARFAEVAAKAPTAPVDLARLAIQRTRARRHGTDQLALAFDRLRERGVFMQLLFSGDEPLHEELEHDGHLERLRAFPNAELGTLPGEDHTLRPKSAQRQAHAALDGAIDRLVAEREAAKLTQTD